MENNSDRPLREFIFIFFGDVPSSSTDNFIHHSFTFVWWWCVLWSETYRPAVFFRTMKTSLSNRIFSSHKFFCVVVCCAWRILWNSSLSFLTFSWRIKRINIHKNKNFLLIIKDCDFFLLSFGCFDILFIFICDNHAYFHIFI